MRRCGLSGAAAERMIEHARRERPRECCGVLVGRPEAILHALPAPNLAEEPGRFLLDPEAHIRIRREARASGLVVVGFYHSHPASPALPSPRDLAESADPDALHVIVSLESGDAAVVRAFTLSRDGFTEVELVGERRGGDGYSP